MLNNVQASTQQLAKFKAICIDAKAGGYPSFRKKKSNWQRENEEAEQRI
jgi:hypothetical protein